jgi:hypothetical protein
MRLPSAPDAPDFEETGPIRVATGARDPSYPDRARIDSDVRYLLRPPSTPWITFDKDQKEEILTSSRSSVIDAPGLFANAPTATPATVVSAPPVEPSNVVVATDIRPAEPSLFDTTHDEPHLPPVAHPKRIMVAVGATLGLAAMILATVFVLGSKKESAPTAATTALPAEVATQNVVSPAPPSPTPPTPAPPTTAAEPKEKSGWAKLTIKGPAKGHRVYLDGKMLLGHGQRSFTIRCGEHTIAVGNKTDARDVDVPCNAEYVVAK